MIGTVCARGEEGGGGGTTAMAEVVVHCISTMQPPYSGHGIILRTCSSSSQPPWPK